MTSRPDEHATRTQLALGFTEAPPKPEDVAAAKAIVAQFGTPIMKALLDEIEGLRRQLADLGVHHVIQETVEPPHGRSTPVVDEARRRLVDQQHQRTEGRYGRD